MKTSINGKNYKTLIKGASIFTTGGGIPMEDQFNALQNMNIKLQLLSLDEFEDDAYLCTVGELGPADAPPLNKENVVKKMLTKLENMTNKKIKGIFPPEIGQESVVLECANLLNLPIADFDPTGFRAVPYFDMNIFNVKRIVFNLAPIIVATDNNQILTIENETSYLNVERSLRKMSSLSDTGIIFLIGMVVSVKKLKKHKLTNPSFSKALSFGAPTTVKKLLKRLSPKMIIDARVVNKSELTIKGFLAEKVTVKNKSWNLFTLTVLNEVLFIQNSDGKVIASVPDRILLIDSCEIRGISGMELVPNKPVTIAVIDPESSWKSKNAEKIIGKNRFKKLLQ